MMNFFYENVCIPCLFLLVCIFYFLSVDSEHLLYLMTAFSPYS